MVVSSSTWLLVDSYVEDEMYTNIAVENVIFSLSAQEIMQVRKWSYEKKLSLCANVRKFADQSKQTDFAITGPTFLRFWDQLNAMVGLRYDDYVGRSHLHCVMAFQVVDENLPTVWSVLCPSSSLFADYLLELCELVEAKLISTATIVTTLPLRLPLLK